MVATVFRTPVMSRPILDTADLIDHLKPLLEKTFSNDVSNIYFGDIGIYLPNHFVDGRRKQKAVIALAPDHDRLVQGSRTAAQESRYIGIEIIGIVNITPYFQASPSEAYGERILSDLMGKVRDFLTQQANVNLDGRVRYLDVGDITWNWMQRKDLSLRAASIAIEATVNIRRNT